MQQGLRHDARLRAAVQEIYDAVYPGEEWHGAVPFAEAERLQTIHYRKAVEAALRARPVLTDRTEQFALI
ncbi:hypothetical protein [Sphingomonas sp. PR090111-T3T-6A]|uniref:hypothetical protein n=1 Tax=Sphingomonas sp. PR090111-T3T-6A TaxID=685778 RepID=UPI00035EA903|nr:hypothetical protein [Sphingomonas sp. PR090111-T3T-6A]